MAQKISTWQRSVLFAMYQYQKFVLNKVHGDVSGVVVVVSRVALTHALWFDWQSYHSDKMQELIDAKWVEQTFDYQGRIGYVLTKIGASCLAGDWHQMSHNCSVFFPDNVPF